METIPFTTRQRTVKLFTVGVIGLVLLLGSSGVTLADRKDRIVRARQCFCECSYTNGGVGVWSWGWDAVQPCNQVGDNCKDTGGSGKFTKCTECVAKNLTTNKYMQCSTANISTAPGGGVIKPPAERGDPVPSTDPFSKSGMKAPIIQRRGVEGDQPADAPPGGSSETESSKTSK